MISIDKLADLRGRAYEAEQLAHAQRERVEAERRDEEQKVARPIGNLVAAEMFALPL